MSTSIQVYDPMSAYNSAINKLEKNSKRDTQRMNNLETQKRNVLDIKIKKRSKK